jgi:hypothetical protein
MPDIVQLFLGPYGVPVATILVFLAGLADGLGTRAVVLLINRITPTAFLVSLLASALLFLLSAAAWIGGVWFFATEFFGMVDALPHFFIGMSLAYIPYLFSVLALLPLLGPPIRAVLRLLSFLIALWVLVMLGLELWQALLCALFGELLLAGIGWLFGEPAMHLRQRAWAALTRKPQPLRSDELPRVIPGYEPERRPT